MFKSVRGDVELAIKANYAYLTIHSLAATDRTVYDKYQRAAHFWMLIASALQTTFFMAFGRIFDKHRESFSIQKLVEATIRNPSFFSKAALRERRRKSENMTGSDPQWLVDYVNGAWEPTAADLNQLRTELMPHYDKFIAIYQPIRHKYFAHRGTESQQAIEELFSKTLKADVGEILGFLHTALWAINNMAVNGQSACRPKRCCSARLLHRAVCFRGGSGGRLGNSLAPESSRP
jgi:AbiU2